MLHKNWALALSALIVGASVASSSHAATIAASQDGFGYQFLSTTPVSGLFSTVLPVGEATSGHGTRSAVQFDTSTLGMTSAQVGTATLELTLGDTTATGFGLNPSTAQPVNVGVYSLTGAWTAATTTWNQLASLTGSLDTSTVVNGTTTTISFDITGLVKGWLDTPSSNNGVLLEAAAAVGTSPNWVYATFNSSGAGGPHLLVTPVPEPSAIVLAALGGLTVLVVGQRARRRAKVQA